MKKEFPLEVKRGSVRVKIYEVPLKKGEETYVTYRVSYYDSSGVRQNKSFADLKEAKTHADTKATELSTGELDAITLTKHHRLAYVRAMEALLPLGISLDMAVTAYAQAIKALKGASLMEAVEFFLRHSSPDRPKKSVQQVVDELVEAKKADKRSKFHVRDLKVRCGAFAEMFKCDIGQITGPDVETFLRSLKVKGRTRNNYRLAIISLFHFAEFKGYVSESVVKSVSKTSKVPTDDGEKITIFTPTEISALLATAAATEPKLLPFIAIGAFAGIRHFEILRLDWADMDFESGFITVRKGKIRTAGRRLIPILPNLKRWLLTDAKKNGPVCAYKSIQRSCERLVQKTRETLKNQNFKWERNALRHSFISYRVADIQNVNQVALEAGNSPQMIMKNYRELVRPAQAKEWFETMPKSGKLGSV